MESRQNILVQQMSGLTNDTLALERNFLKLKGALEMMRSFELRVAHLLKIEGAIQQVTVLADKYFAGLSSLMDGKVSMDLVSSKVARREIKDLKAAAFPNGFALFKHDSLLFQLDGRLVRVKGDSNMVAVSANKDEFAEGSGSDLHGCLHIGSVFLCHYLGVKILASFPCCLCDIFTGKTSEMMRDCDLTLLSEKFWLDRINFTSFLYYANSS